MKSLVLKFILGLMLVVTATATQSMASVASEQQNAVVSSQAGDIPGVVISAPEVAALPAQNVESTNLFAALTPGEVLLAQNDGSTGSPTDTPTGIVTDTSTGTVTGDLIKPVEDGNTRSLPDLLKSNWAELLLGLLAFIKILVRITPSLKDDTVFGKIDSLINAIVPNFQSKNKSA